MASCRSRASPIISSEKELKRFLSTINSSSTLFLDLEGRNLSRDGTITILTILAHPNGDLRLIDVLALGTSAFTTAASGGYTLKSILESSGIAKFMWGAKQDADALWALYGVCLTGVTDIQFLEHASRVGNKVNHEVRGLAKAVQFDLELGAVERNSWLRTKKDVTALMPSNIFTARPMKPRTIQYCANDVVHLPALRDLYRRRISDEWYAEVKERSERLLEEARSPSNDPRSFGALRKILGPWGSGSQQPARRVEDESADP